MISRLRLSNYRSVDEVDLRLDRLTALVGTNGSGKSNVVDSLRFVAEALTMGLGAAVTVRHGMRAVRRWSRGRPYDVSFYLHVKGTDFTGSYSFVLTGDHAEEYCVKSEEAEVNPAAGKERHVLRVVNGEWKEPSDLRPSVARDALALPLVSADPRFRPLYDLLRNTQVYSIFPDTLREPQKYDPTYPLRKHGENWCSLLRDQAGRPWKQDLLAALGKLTGDIDDIKITPAGGYLVARFRHAQPREPAIKKKREKWFDAAQESDGTLRFAGMLTALMREPPLALVALEEPELTIHAGALPLLHDHLREAAQRTQALVTTHSPELLDCFTADQLRIVGRNRSGTTVVHEMNHGHRESVRKGLLSLGDLLRMGELQQSEFSFAEPSIDSP